MRQRAAFDGDVAGVDDAVPVPVPEPSGIEILFQHVWMQKHPTPARRQGQMHWHPAGIPVAIRSALTELAARNPDERASAWIIGADHVVWARAFSAGMPGDPRPYTGLAATIAWPDQSVPWHHALAEILARMPLPPPGPHDGSIPADQICEIPDPLAGLAIPSPRAVDPEALSDLFAPGSTDLARAVYLGGPVYCLDAHSPRLPALLARLLSWLPERERAHPRTGLFVSHGVPADISGSADRGLVNLFHYLTRAWFCAEAIRSRQPGFPVQAWQLVLDLSESLGRSLPDLLRDLGAVVAAWDRAEDLRHYLLEQRILTYQQIDACDRRAPRPLFVPGEVDAGWQWNRIMHYWGRSFLRLDDEEQLPALAALLAQRIAVDHLSHLDAPERSASPRRHLRRLMYEALLPQERLATMIRALARYVPSLLRYPEVPFG